MKKNAQIRDELKNFYFLKIAQVKQTLETFNISTVPYHKMSYEKNN